MERRRKRTRRAQPRRVAKRQIEPSAACSVSRFRNIEELIAWGGNITLGRTPPIGCMATAADEDICYAMLVRRPGETVLELLERLDHAIELASKDLVTIDEVNAPSPSPKSMRP